MKTPIDIVRGHITDIDEHGIVTIKCRYDDWPILLKREYKECNIQMIDGRPLSDKQRRTCYKLLREISNYTGMGLDPAKEWLKIKFLVEDLEQTADQMFSLSNAPMSLVCAFQRFLVRFILDYDIPCSFSLLDFVDDITDYVYACAVRKKCCICGRKADPHHCERIGMGRNRDELDQEGMLMEPLCRKHHEECHAMPQKEFDRKYHIAPVAIDKELKKIWRFTGELERYDGRRD